MDEDRIKRIEHNYNVFRLVVVLTFVAGVLFLAAMG